MNASESKIKDNVKSKEIWQRLIFMIIVSLLYTVSRVVVMAVVVMQFFWILVTAESNEKLRVLGNGLSVYTYQILMYLTFNSEARPYPFDLEWPDPESTPRIAN